MAIQIKRAYDPPSTRDGRRVLVDRLWPRGISKQTAHIHRWLRDLAPSNSLRRWFRHRPEYFPTFRKRYMKELATPAASAALEELYGMAGSNKRLTLIYSAKDTEYNNAIVLKELLEGMRKPPSSSGAAHAVGARMRARMPRP